MEDLDTFTRRGSNEFIAAPQRALEQELNEWPGAGTLNEWPGAGTTKAVFVYDVSPIANRRLGLKISEEKARVPSPRQS